jgi:hypothetical protein
VLTTPPTNVLGAAVTAASGALEMMASILAGGTNQQFLGTLRDRGNNLTSDPSVPLTAPTSRRISDLKLGPFGMHGGWVPTESLLPGSPALDAVFGGDCPPSDQRGVARPVGERCDIGAYEWLPRPLSRWSEDGFFQWDLVLQPQHRYQIETTVDSVAWSSVESLRSDSLGRITFTDRQTARTPWRFYRIVDQP